MSSPTLVLDVPGWHRLLFFRDWISSSWVALQGEAVSFADYVESIGLVTGSLRQAETIFDFDTPNFENYVGLEGRQSVVLSQNFDNLHENQEWVGSIIRAFPNHHVVALFQSEENDWSLSFEPEESGCCVVVISNRELPVWPMIGLSMPTISPERVLQATNLLYAFYPGRLAVVATANGWTEDRLAEYQARAKNLPLTFLPSKENLGYGGGANLGLDWLLKFTSASILGVTNDDIAPDTDCLPELVTAFLELTRMDQNPGMIAPVSNSVSGIQQVEVEPYTSLPEMLRSAARYRRPYHRSATPALQVRGLFFLSPRELFENFGGFDPVFGLGNFEDDDLNLRSRLAGYSLWVAPGAYLHHDGSATFADLGIDYQNSIEAGMKIFTEKWKTSTFEQAMRMMQVPEGVSLNVPLTAA